MGRAVEVDKERKFWIAFDYREKDQMIRILDCVWDRQRWRSSIADAGPMHDYQAVLCKLGQNSIRTPRYY